MIGRRLSAFALLLACASAPLHANMAGFDRECWQGSDVQALKVQRFKTMLLVAMLNCRDQEPGIAVDYNRFVRANRDLIADNQARVREHFIRTRGAGAGLNAYSSFETALGNQYSGADFTPGRCADAAAEAREASYVSERGLMDIIQSMPDEEIGLCGPQPRYAMREQWVPRTEQAYAPQPELAYPPQAEETSTPPAALAEAAPPPPPPAAMEQAAAPVEMAQNEQEWPDLAPIEPEGPARAVDPNQVRLAEAVPAPAATVEKAAEPVQLASVDVQKAAPGPDRMKAVRDAAKALREALAALETEDAASVK
jgi:hypothetical protein